MFDELEYSYHTPTHKLKRVVALLRVLTVTNLACYIIYNTVNINFNMLCILCYDIYDINIINYLYYLYYYL